MVGMNDHKLLYSIYSTHPFSLYWKLMMIGEKKNVDWNE